MIDARQHVTLPQGRFKVNQGAVIGIAVHHSVTSISASATEAQEIAAIRVIDTFHVQQGFGCFGYHLTAFPSGRLYHCGDLDGARAHVASRNHELIGIVAIGTFTNALPNDSQMNAIAEGIKEIRGFYARDLPIKGHNEWALPGNGTGCAGTLNGFDWEPWLAPAPEPPAFQPSEVEALRALVSAGHIIRSGNQSLADLGETDKQSIRWIEKQLG